jgi:hypothetical protein
MDNKLILKNAILNSLKKLNAFWSYNNSDISEKTISDEMLIEKSLIHLDIDDMLMGGTALALQLKHRQSEDLDFCRWHKIKNERLEYVILAT